MCERGRRLLREGRGGDVVFADERNRTMYHVSCEAIRQYVCVVVSFVLLTGEDLTADRYDSEFVWQCRV